MRRLESEGVIESEVSPRWHGHSCLWLGLWPGAQATQAGMPVPPRRPSRSDKIAPNPKISPALSSRARGTRAWRSSKPGLLRRCAPRKDKATGCRRFTRERQSSSPKTCRTLRYRRNQASPPRGLFCQFFNPEPDANHPSTPPGSSARFKLPTFFPTSASPLPLHDHAHSRIATPKS